VAKIEKGLLKEFISPEFSGKGEKGGSKIGKYFVGCGHWVFSPSIPAL
jgi:hypothetical protein